MKRVVLLVLLLASLCSPTLWAASCTAVFPAAFTPNSSAELELTGVPWKSAPALVAQNRSLAAGDHYFGGGSSGNGWTLIATGGPTTRVFVDGNLRLANNSQLNAGGDPEDLIVVVRGNLTLDNNVVINGFVYVTGSIDFGNNLDLYGAISAEGGANSPYGGSASLVYAEDAVVQGNTSTLCGIPEPELYLHFDEASWSGSSGEVLDDSGNALHGTALNGANTANALPALIPLGGLGTCGYGVFAGGSHVQMADAAPLDFDSALSMGFWIRPTQTPVGSVTLVDKGSNYRLELNSSRRLVLTARFSYGLVGSETLTVTSTSALPLNAWTHVGFVLELKKAFLVRDQLSGRIFINGGQAGSAQTSEQYLGATVPNTFALRVGGSGSNGLTGFIDEVRLFQTPLVAGDFAALMAERHPCLASSVHHYRLGFSTPMLSCKPIPVTVTACADSSCSSTVSTSDSIALLPAGAWIGGAGKTFASSDTLTAYLKREAGTRVLGVSGASYDCTPADCTLVIQDSGFVFSNLTPMIAGKPQSAVIQAVKKDDATQACVPAFAGGSRTLQFSAAYVTPESGSLSPSVAGVSLAPVGSSKDVSLSFDAEAKAAIEVVYADAGEVSLTASHVGAANPGNPAASEELLSMSGSASFVSRPYGLCLQTAAVQGNDYGADSSLFPGGVRAGDSFALTIKPVIWTQATAAAPPLQAAAICGNAVTPNYLQTDIMLSSVERNGGNPGQLGLDYHHHRDPNDPTKPPPGGTRTINQSISEVGVFQLTATPPAYLGADMSHAVSQSGRVGRFIPAYFKAEGFASLKPSCGSTFSYQGQPMAFADGLAPSLIITAYSRLHNKTLNYDRPGFWKLAAPAVGSYASVTAELLDPADPSHASTVARDARLVIQGTASLSEAGVNDGDGARQYTWSGQALLYSQPLVPGVADYPFRARIRQDFSANSLRDPEGACHGDGSSCQPYGYVFADSPGSEVRLGRLRISNAHGSELQDLSLPLFLESWRDTAGGSFQVESMDTCTVLDSASLGDFTGNLAASETTPTTSEPFAGVGSLRLAAPGAGNDGSVRAGFPGLPLWLQYPWDGAVRQGASGLATFGIYRGPAPLIFRRELYRQ